MTALVGLSLRARHTLCDYWLNECHRLQNAFQEEPIKIEGGISAINRTTED
jgi:hypothetical protein